MAAVQSATLGAFPPARAQGGAPLQPGHRSSRGDRAGAPTPTGQSVPRVRPVLRPRLGGPVGGALYTGTGPASLAALGRINAKVRRSHACQQRATDLRQQGE